MHGKFSHIDFYESNVFPDMSNAADTFLNQLDEEKSRILEPTNAKRTLVDALSAYKKKNQK